MWSKYNVVSSISRHVSAAFQNVYKTYLMSFFSGILKTFQNKTLPTKLLLPLNQLTLITCIYICITLYITKYMVTVIAKVTFNYRYINMPHALTSVYRILFSTLRKVIEAFMQLVSSEINHPYHLLPFLRGAVILIS